ncbi:Hypothetical protein FKW44_012651 [Caligus rogercresseyi]|uniref:Uncharacterized protein n=1 Tax=Caligus rogercresseyi TaxID=217165 RepID=A0A7T8K8Z3_CALRO|nr:Hypothetical protein FKW44_012651 [Caligus rogercresseyi]
MEEKRIRVSALLDAQMDSRRLLSSSLLLGARFQGTRPWKETWTAEFLADIADTIEASPTTSVRKQAKNLGVSKDTIGMLFRTWAWCLMFVDQGDQGHKGKKLLTWMKHNGSTVGSGNPLDYGIWGVVEEKGL